MHVFAWIVLLAIPFVSLGWIVGNVGFVLDDWAAWKTLDTRPWFNLDPARPLALAPMALLHAICGMNYRAAFALLLLAHGICAVMSYEIARRWLKDWLAERATLAAWFASLIFVLYPADVSRLWLTASLGARFVTIEVFLALLLWTLAVRRGAPWIALLALLPAAETLLRAESGFFVVCCAPLLAFVRGRRLQLPSRQWLIVTAIWCASIGVYLIWRLKFAGSRWLWGDFGTETTIIRPLHLPSGLALLGSIANGMQLMTIDTARRSFEAAFSLGLGSVLLPALFAPILVVASGWLLWRSSREIAPAAAPLKFGEWLVLLAFFCILAIAGILPYLFNGDDKDGVVVFGILSRFAAIGSIGLSMALVWLAFVPIDVRIGGRRFQSTPLHATTAAALLTAIILGLAVVRQNAVATEFARAWTIQKSYLHALAERADLFQPGTTIVLHDFPVYVGQAPMANQSWAILGALGLLLSPAPAPPMLGPRAPLRIFPDNAGETSDWRFDGSRFSVKWFALRNRVSIERERLVVVRFDRERGIVETLTTFPATLLPARIRPVQLYTGLARPIVSFKRTAFATNLFASVPGGCLATVSLNSPADAPADITVRLLPDPGGVDIDRRFVRRGQSLDYRTGLPCDTSIGVRLDSAPIDRFTDASGVKAAPGFHTGNKEARTTLSRVPIKWLGAAKQ